MIEGFKLGGAMLGGVALGALFFGGLWWTVRRGLSSRQPAALFLGSLLFRTLLVVAGFFFVSQGDWRNLVASLAGFLVARTVIMRVFGPAADVARDPLLEGAQ
ncbi:ATP synthase subunit I [soil metagenome]